MKRWIGYPTGAWLLAISALYGCGGNDNPTNTPSDDPPAAVADLTVVSADDTTLTLAWTAPADPSKRAAVEAYDLRYAKAMITNDTWDDATQAVGEPVPADSGTADTMTVGGLEFATMYYFALKSRDDKDQWSALSNILAASTDTIDNRLIAYYPLVDDSADVTGMNPPIHLVNAPFQAGGIYLNGVYLNSGEPDRSGGWTPTLDSLDLASFTISARFKVDEYDTTGYRPVFVAGDAWRWAGVRLENDSTVTLMYNDGGTVHTDAIYMPETWHEAAITYDGTTLELFFDGTKVAEKETALITGDRRQVGTFNNGNGYAFKGIFGRLKVYSAVVRP